MQRAKDTFYIAMRDRIATLNPARTVLVRGVLRPGVLVEENELAIAYQAVNVFRLRWTDVSLVPEGTMPLVKMRCEIHYSTAGDAGNGGMDRGRLMTAMDAELADALNSTPQSVARMDYADASDPQPDGSNIFWGDVNFAALKVTGEQLERIANVDVYSYQEAGGL